MKILQINKFPYLKGGAERYFFGVSALLVQHGHQVVRWSTRHPQGIDLPHQDTFPRYNDLSQRKGLVKDLRKVKNMFWNKEAANRLEQLILREKPDLAHLHNVFSHLAPAIIFTLRKHNIPIVMTLHDYKLFCPNYQFFTQGEACFDCLQGKTYFPCIKKKCVKNSLPHSIIAYLEAVWNFKILKVHRHIDYFIAPSAFMREQALAWGLKPVVHLPNFIDIDKFRKELYNDETVDKYFLSFSRLSQEKGVDLLIEAFKTVVQEHPEVKLKIAGDGPDRSRLEAMAEGIAQIEFIGRQSIGEIKKLLAGAYAAVIPSRWPENFPYTVLEASALSKPVIASRIGGLPAMVESDRLFQPGNVSDLAAQLLWAVKHPKQVKQIGERAHRKLAVCSPTNHYRDLIQIYDRIKSH